MEPSVAIYSGLSTNLQPISGQSPVPNVQPMTYQDKEHPQCFYNHDILHQAIQLQLNWGLKISTKGWGGSGSARSNFPLKNKQTKNMGLKHWILPKTHCKTHLFFQLWVEGPSLAWILVWRVALWRGHLTSLKGDRYHTGFVWCHASFFLIIFFALVGWVGGVRHLSVKNSTIFLFLNPSLINIK